jgi:hypothetical protein
VTRRLRILHRKPRTRRDRMAVRLQAVRDDAGRRWKRLRHPRRRDAALLRTQELLAQLTEALHTEAEPSPRTRPGRLHLRHTPR